MGGTTLINWTSSFRTPPQTLKHWAAAHGVTGLGEHEMQPWFERIEHDLGITPWAMPANANNDVLRRGCERLGYRWAVIPRNARLLEPRLLRHGLPGERQAVDAGHAHPGDPRKGR